MCKKLSLWYSHGKRDDIFWRTAGSGARATVRMKSGKCTNDSAGDMCSLGDEGLKLTSNSIWEFKRGYTSKKNANMSISLIPILDKLAKEKEPLLIQWFKKLFLEMKDHKKSHGFIIFKRDRKNACIAFSLETWSYLKTRNVKKYYNPPFGPTALILAYDVDFVVMLLDDFLFWCEPETIGRRIHRRMKGLPYEQEPGREISEPKLVERKTGIKRFLSVQRSDKERSNRKSITTRRQKKR